MTLREITPDDVDLLRLWASQDHATAKALGPDVLTTMPICYAVVNGSEAPVGFVGGQRIGPFLNGQIVIDPEKRKGWLFNKLCQLGEQKARDEGVRVIVALPQFFNGPSRAMLRWRKYLPIPVVMFHPTEEVKTMLMGKVL